MKRLLAREVWRRAKGVCEYCRMPQTLHPTPFQIDHIIAQQHEGKTESRNLALACFYCNTYKGPNLAGIDPVTRRIVRLFHPRRDQWERHFRWHNAKLGGLTPVGRATIQVLNMNHPDFIAVRKVLIQEGIFPPPF